MAEDAEGRSDDVPADEVPGRPEEKRQRESEPRNGNRPPLETGTSHARAPTGRPRNRDPEVRRAEEKADPMKLR